MDKYRVLVIDDDVDILSLLENILCREYEVVCMNNPNKALNRLEEIDPDFFIVDVMMPLMDGRALVRTIRNNSKYASSPVIFLSVVTDRSVIIDSYNSGGDLYITKPFSPNRLTRSIKAFLERKGMSVKAKKFRHGILQERLARPATDDFQKVKHKQERSREKVYRETEDKDKKSRETKSPSPYEKEKIPSAKQSKPVHVRLQEKPIEEKTSPQKAKPAKASPKHKKISSLARILIADDDSELLDFLTLSLGDKYEMFTARNGLDVVKHADILEPDLFILDALMPRFSGYQVCQVLKKSEKFARTPIIMISAKASRKDVEYVKKLGVKAFIPKPFDFMQLDNAIVRIIKEPYFEISPKTYSYQEIIDERETEAIINEDKVRERKHRETKHILQDFISDNIDEI